MKKVELGGLDYSQFKKKLAEDNRKRKEASEAKREEIYFSSVPLQLRTKVRVPVIITNRKIETVAFNRKTEELIIDGKPYEIQKKFLIPLLELSRYTEKPRYQVLVENNKVKKIIPIGGWPPKQSLVSITDFEGNRREVRVTIH